MLYKLQFSYYFCTNSVLIKYEYKLEDLCIYTTINTNVLFSISCIVASTLENIVILVRLLKYFLGEESILYVNNNIPGKEYFHSFGFAVRCAYPLQLRVISF